MRLDIPAVLHMGYDGSRHVLPAVDNHFCDPRTPNLVRNIASVKKFIFLDKAQKW